MRKLTQWKNLLLGGFCVLAICFSVIWQDKAAYSDETDLSSKVDYLVNLPIQAPDFSSKQDKNPVGKMHPPESLVGSGAFPDNYFNSEILHTGARGCLACHVDLYSLIKNRGPTLHVASHTSYGKPDDILDCKGCHDIAGNLTGPKLADIIHASHSNNELFWDAYKGNCWSCHAIDPYGERVLWETIKYEASIAGYPEANNPDVIGWLKSRGFKKGYMTGFEMVDDLGLDIVSENGDAK